MVFILTMICSYAIYNNHKKINQIDQACNTLTISVGLQFHLPQVCLYFLIQIRVESAGHIVGNHKLLPSKKGVVGEVCAGYI